MAHKWGSLDDLPSRPTAAALAEKGQNLYLRALERHAALAARFQRVSDLLASDKENPECCTSES